MVLTRQSFLKRSGAAVVAAGGAASLTVLERAEAAPRADQPFVTPFEPTLSFHYPTPWYVYVNPMEEVDDPHVVISSRALGPLADIGGLPEMRDAPPDAALLTYFPQFLPPDHDTSTALSLEGTMNFEALGQGEVDDTPAVGRRFSTWYVDGAASLPVYLLLGVDVSDDWHAMRSIINSTRLAH